MGRSQDELLLSIIVPVYNVEPFLEDCIRSIERIKTPKEIICVNDGSTDNSLLRLKKLADEFNDISILDQKNKGVSHSRNNGISQAKGKYICFFDSDDMVIAETIDKAILLLEEKKADCAAYDYKNIAENNRYQDFFDADLPVQDVTVSEDMRLLYVKRYIWTAIVKKEIIDDHGIVFCEGMRYFEDQCFMRDICANCKSAIVLREPGYLYRARSSSAMHRAGRYKPWTLDAIKGAVHTKRLEENATNEDFKKHCHSAKQLLVLHAMTMGIMVPEFNARWIIRELKDNGLFPFKPMWRLLVPNGKSTVLNYLRFGFFSRGYYGLFFWITRMMKRIK